MKWITRERARVDRIACPWLITRFIDPEPELLFVPAREVLAAARREDAIPYDIPDVELGHRGPRCSFDAFVDRYELDDPPLAQLALIVRGADTDDRGLAPEAAGSTLRPLASRRSAGTTTTTWRTSSRCTTPCTPIAGRRPTRPHGGACSSCACTAPPRAWSPRRISGASPAPAGWGSTRSRPAPSRIQR